MNKRKVFPIRIMVQRLHLFTDDTDTFVAFDAADAEKAYSEHVGETRSDSIGISDLDPYIQIKDDAPVTLWFEDDEKSYPLFSKIERPKDRELFYVTAPAWAWVLHNGRGFLCSTEW
jgi:hypothetical protein